MAKASPWHHPVFSWQREALLSLACQLSELGAAPSGLASAQEALSSPKTGPSKLKWLRTFAGLRLWLVALVTAVGFWNWQLLLAAGAGVLSTVLAYQMQGWNWQRLGSALRKFLAGSNRRLVLAVGTGGLATLTTYMAISVWIELKPWAAAGTILQGLGTLAVLVLLVWQTTYRPKATGDPFNQRLIDLTHPDPLKRLIAVHQLTQLASRFDGTGDRLSRPETYRRIAAYFRLMLRHETEAVIQEAILDGLQIVENSQKLNLAADPLLLPDLSKQAGETQQSILKE